MNKPLSMGEAVSRELRDSSKHLFGIVGCAACHII
jgi:hypothetical protein